MANAIDFKDPRIIGLFTMVGAVLLIAAYFLNWIDMATTAMGNTTHLYIDVGDLEDADGWQSNVPLIGLIFGIIILAIEILDLIAPKAFSEFSSVIVFALSIAGIVLLILFMTWSRFEDIDLVVSKVTFDMTTGFYVALAGAIVALVFSVGQAVSAFKTLRKN